MKKKVLEKIVERDKSFHTTKATSRQVSIRLSEAENLKMEQWGRETGLSAASIMRKFITEGAVNVRYDAQRVIKDIADTHQWFNLYSHKITDDVAVLQNTFSKIEKNLAVGVNDASVKALITNAAFLTDQMLKNYLDERANIDMELKKHVDIHSGK